MTTGAFPVSVEDTEYFVCANKAKKNLNNFVAMNLNDALVPNRKLLYICKWTKLIILWIKPSVSYPAFTSFQLNVTQWARFIIQWRNPLAHMGCIPYSISQKICTRFLLCCALLWLYIDWFSHIHQAYFTGTVAIWRLPQCQQSNPDKYGSILHLNSLWTIT